MFRLYVNAKKAAISLTLALSLVANGNPNGHSSSPRLDLDRIAADSSPQYTEFYFLFKLQDGESEFKLNSRLEGTSERGKHENDPESGERKLHPVKLDAAKTKMAQNFIKEAKGWRDDLDACVNGKIVPDPAAKSFVALLDRCVVEVMFSRMRASVPEFAENQVGQCWIDIERAVKARGKKISQEKSDKFLEALKNFMGALDVDRSAIQNTQAEVSAENSPRKIQRSIFDLAETAVKDADKANAKSCAVIPPAGPVASNKPNASSSDSATPASEPASPSSDAPVTTERTKPTGDVSGGGGGLRKGSNAKPNPVENSPRAGGDPYQPGAPGGFNGPLQPSASQPPFDASAILPFLSRILQNANQAPIVVPEPRSATGGTRNEAAQAAQPPLPSLQMPMGNPQQTPPPPDNGQQFPQMIAGPTPPPPVTPSPVPSSSPYAGMDQLSKSLQAAFDSIGQKVTDMNKATNETMNSILAGMAGGMGAYNPFAMQQPQQVAQQTPGINTVGNYLANGRSSTNTFANGRANTANTSMARGRTPSSGRTSPDQFASTFSGTGSVNFNTGRGQSPAAQPTGDVGGNYRGNL